MLTSSSLVISEKEWAFHIVFGVWRHWQTEKSVLVTGGYVIWSFQFSVQKSHRMCKAYSKKHFCYVYHESK